MKLVVLVLMVVVVRIVAVVFVRVVVVLVVFQLDVVEFVAVDEAVGHLDDDLDDHVPDDQVVLDRGVDNHWAGIRHNQDDTFDYTENDYRVNSNQEVSTVSAYRTLKFRA